MGAEVNRNRATEVGYAVERRPRRRWWASILAVLVAHVVASCLANLVWMVYTFGHVHGQPPWTWPLSQWRDVLFSPVMVPEMIWWAAADPFYRVEVASVLLVAAYAATFAFVYLMLHRLIRPRSHTL